MCCLLSRSNCEQGQRIVGACKEAEDHLNGSEAFKGLGIIIKIVGSSVEGTKIGNLDEADCMLLCENLKEEHFELTNSATKYKITDKGKPYLEPFLDEEGCLCLLYTSPSPRDKRQSRMPSSA